MSNRIIVCGGNGAGKSTLGRRLAAELGWTFKDIEEYYFPVSDMNYNYAHARSKEQVSEVLLADMKECENFLLASVKGEFGPKVSKLFTCAILIEVPKELRMERVRDRSNQKFGDRMLPGGDLYEKEEQFFDMVDKRPEDYTTKWLETVDIPIIRVDGTKTIEENVEKIKEEIRQFENKPKYLYHGSQYYFDVLKPQQANGACDRESMLAIYAAETMDEVIPFALPIRWYPDNPSGKRAFECEKGLVKLLYGSINPDGIGYVYKIKSDDFIKIDEWQWISKNEIIPEEVMEISVRDYWEWIEMSEEARKIHKELYGEDSLYLERL